MNAPVALKLKVYPAFSEDVYKDIARIHKNDRGEIPQGRICNVTANGRTKQFIVRGIPADFSEVIMLDDISREALNLQEGIIYQFRIEKAGVWGHIKWACSVTDPGARIAAWIAVVSLALGIVGIILSIISLL